MIAIRGPKGLGDAVYLRALVLHLLDRGEEVTVFTRFPDAFADLPVTTRPMKDGEEQPGLRHFTHKVDSDLDYFQDSCRRAGFPEPVPMTMRWTARNKPLLDRILSQAAGRKILVFQPTKRPRNESHQMLRPSRGSYNAFLDAHADHFRVKLGHTDYVEDRGEPCDLDLLNKTSIHDAFDIGSIGALFFGEPCFIPMLGEANDKPFTIMFTRRALDSKDRVRDMTPERMIHKKHIGTAVIDEY